VKGEVEIQEHIEANLNYYFIDEFLEDAFNSVHIYRLLQVQQAPLKTQNPSFQGNQECN
jgi:hypothetical protein